MNASAYHLILKKRNGAALTGAEITEFIAGYTAGAIHDYQAAALLMAIYFRGMTAQETADLTAAMVASGDTVDLSGMGAFTVDKHSTGGVGDKTTLVLAPMLAASGCTVAKMSGRGLGHTGGTLDKLESIPGFRTDLEAGQMLAQVARIGLAVVAQTGRLVPADGLLYALRDVTATVDSIPLIASSIMSKKLAAGAQTMVLDVKTGSGAFMRDTLDAFALAQAMVSIAARAGRRAVAVVSNMQQPLGHAVGNAVEVQEAIDTLRGKGPADLRALCLVLGSHLLLAAGLAPSIDLARDHLAGTIDHGQALERFHAFVLAQGGDGAVVDRPQATLPAAPLRRDLPAPAEGFVSGIDALTVGDAARTLGAGRQRKGDAVDLGAGVLVHAKIGDRLAHGDIWATVLASSEQRLRAGMQRLAQALTVSHETPRLEPFIFGVVDPDGRETRYPA